MFWVILVIFGLVYRKIFKKSIFNPNDRKIFLKTTPIESKFDMGFRMVYKFPFF
jgi:hypothetical protein